MLRRTFAALSFVSLAITAPAQDRDLTERFRQMEATLERQRIAMHVPGCAIAIVSHDALVYHKGFGVADLESQRPVASDTIFAIGSATKAFTATLVGMLVDEKKLSFDDAVTQYLPEFRLPIRSDDASATVNFRDLLAHRTGFARGDLLWAGGTADSATILATIIHAEPIDGFREGFHYNNLMFLAAAEAASKITKLSWRDSLRTRLLEPLGMNDTTLSVADAKRDARLASGYEWITGGDRFDRREMRVLDGIAPAGAINSNVIDMSQWLRFQLAHGAIDGKRLLSEETHRETWTKQQSIKKDSDYGLGWFLDTWRGQPVVHHGGNIDGFSAMVAMLPDSQLGLVLLTNASSTPLQDGVRNIVWESLLGEAAPQSTVDRGDRGPCVGTYVANFANFHDAKFVVTEADGKLFVDVPGQMNFELKEPDADGKRSFAITDEVAVRFDTNGFDVIVQMTMFQNGLTFEMFRLGYVPEAEIDLTDAERFCGKYHDPIADRDFTVLIQNHRLAVDVPTQMVYELHAPDADGRRVTRINAKHSVRFESDATGTVTGLELNLGKSQRQCPRVAATAATSAPVMSVEALHTLRQSDARRDALAKFGAFRMSGTLTLMNMGASGRLKLLANGNDRHAMDFAFEPFAHLRSSFCRGVATSANSIAPRENLAGPQIEQARLENPSVAFGDWRQFFDVIEPLRFDTLDGAEVVVVKLVSAGGVEFTSWIDKKTGDTLREDTVERLPGGGSLPSTARYTDFRNVGDLRIPWRIESQNDVRGRSVVVIESVETGLELGDEAFRIDD